MDKIPYWQMPIESCLAFLNAEKSGLTSEEAILRQKLYGPNTLAPPKKGKGILLFLSQFKSPLILLLIAAALLSLYLGGESDAIIIFSIVFLSGILGYVQERGAVNALEQLLQLVENKVTVLRDGKETEVSQHLIVPGDVIILRAGDVIPADCRLLETKHFFADEATLTGESTPSEKNESPIPLETPFAKRTNVVYMGTLTVCGRAAALVMATGLGTEFSQITERIRFRPPETAFELGVRKFSYLLLEITMVLLITIFAVNTYFHKPIVESLLFSLALAVGLTPQLLPAIISVNLSHGARRMAQQKVVVKRLASLENFGQMNVLCADKTGTLTEGRAKLEKAVDSQGNLSKKVGLYAYLNAHFQSGLSNPLDKAILNDGNLDVVGWNKIDEIPHDFSRKRVTVVFEHEGQKLLICKGALPQIISICDRIELPDGTISSIDFHKDSLMQYFENLSKEGFRALALAAAATEEEKNLVFLGFLHFYDPIKPNITDVIADLSKKGVRLKIITGDLSAVAVHVASSLGFPRTSIITGSEIHQVSDRALIKIAHEKNIFAEIEPNQKERIILALRKGGHVVGFLGDGVNDVSALHSADVSIAVDAGADAAKEASDIILLDKDLSVLRAGIEEGRRTFINTLKYVYMATSANLGNMFSMAGASLFLPFLPLLPKQVLLTNFFSDLPEMALATDHVDTQTIAKPVKWDLKLIRRFMVVFGLLNSFADFMTFGVLLFILNANEAMFRSGWFVENVVSAALVVLAIRTRRPLIGSRPGKLLMVAVFAVALAAPLLPYTPLGRLFDLTPLPGIFYVVLGGIIAIYLFAVEITKRFFFGRAHH